MINDEYTPDLELDANNDQDFTSTDNSDESYEEVEPDAIDWKAEAEKSKAEALKYKAILDRNKHKTPEQKTSKKSDEMDYGQKAYLAANGIKGVKEFDFVKNEMKNSGMDIDSLLENGYFKSQLETFRAINQTVDAVPTGKRSSGVPTDSVEYWMSKPIEEVPSEMRIKVVNAKMNKDKNKGMFYNS